MRLNRFLASCNLGSRRKMDALIMEGRVSVNGTPVDNPGIRVDAALDRVLVDGNPVSAEAEEALYLLNKPTGYITTMDDPQGRKTVVEFLTDIPWRLYPVGRLDRDTSGLLLFTNSGDLCHRLTHPSFGVEKEYRVTTDAPLTPERRRLLQQGVPLEEGVTSPAQVLGEEGAHCFRLILHEGWKRQVRRMCSGVGFTVLSLERVRYAFLTLDGTPRGTKRRLNGDEVARLKQIVGL